MHRFRLLGVGSLITVTFLALAGCGGGSSPSHASSTSSSTSSSAASSSAALPSVSGSYGQKPSLTFGAGKPSSSLQTKVLSQGSGPVVQKGQLLVADYLGQIWSGKVFDNSYDRGQPAAFQIGVGKVIPGWDKGLVGQKAGSRVLLVIPPADGYGAQGNAQAGIKGTDTLVFVVDIVTAYGKTVAGDPKAAPTHAKTGGIHVGGPLGGRPSVSIAKGTKEPTKQSLTVIARGHGPAVKSGLLVVQYEAKTWTGQSAGSTWQEGAPAGVPVTPGAAGSPFTALAGIPLGSRVLLEIPSQNGASGKTPSIAVVVDVVAQPPAAKDAKH